MNPSLKRLLSLNIALAMAVSLTTGTFAVSTTPETVTESGPDVSVQRIENGEDGYMQCVSLYETSSDLNSDYGYARFYKNDGSGEVTQRKMAAFSVTNSDLILDEVAPYYDEKGKVVVGYATDSYQWGQTYPLTEKVWHVFSPSEDTPTDLYAIWNYVNNPYVLYLNDTCTEPFANTYYIQQGNQNQIVLLDENPFTDAPASILGWSTEPSGKGDFYQLGETIEVNSRITLFPVLDMPYEIANGQCGYNLTWSLYENGYLEIKGSGPMWNYTQKNCNWVHFADQIQHVILDENITSIGTCAFYGCSSLEDINIPEGVSSIGYCAFCNCTSLTSVEIPSTVMWLGASAFSGCKNLSELTFNENSQLTSIQASAFYNCAELEHIELPKSVEEIGETAFYVCKKLSSIEIPAGVTKINNGTFKECTGLETVTFASGSALEQIRTKAFYDCSKLTEIKIPKTVNEIGSDAFHNCAAIAEIEIPEGVERIGSGTFCDCKALQKVIFSEKSQLTTIEDSAFANTGLTKVIIPKGVTTIGNLAFNDQWNERALSCVEFLGDAPTSFGRYVFRQSGLGKFVIQYHNGNSGWTSPKWNEYYAVCVDETIQDFITLDTENRNAQGILFTLNDDAGTAVVGSNLSSTNNSGYYGNNNGTVVIPDVVKQAGKTYSVIGIGQNAFSENKTLSAVILGCNVSSIDPSAFQNCTAFKRFEVSGKGARYSAVDGVLFDAAQLTLYSYPCGKENAFYSLPETVKTISSYSFAGNVYLTELYVPNTVQYIGQRAFSQCMNLKSVTLPFIGKSIDGGERLSVVFNNNDFYLDPLPKQLETVKITGGTLNPYSFYRCANLKKIELPAQDEIIPDYCFQNCSKLESLVFADNTEISGQMKAGEIVIPERIKRIGRAAFSNCSTLEHVELLEGLETISDSAFNGCLGLRTVEIPSTVSDTGSGAFSGCKSNTAFTVAESNKSYCSDVWGVLYSKDMETLICYPSMRRWPYYNVSEKTTQICSDAFSDCVNLVNLYIPKTVSTMNYGCISCCPGMTVCAFIDSAAYTYAGRNSLTIWPMENFTLQGIQIVNLPEKTTYRLGETNFDGLYVAADGGKQLQLEDYSLTYDAMKPGEQQVIVSYQGMTATFNIELTTDDGCVFTFENSKLPENMIAYAAFYNENGKMLTVQPAESSSDGIRTVVSYDNLSNAQKAKLFVLDGTSFLPTEEVTIQNIEKTQ